MIPLLVLAYFSVFSEQAWANDTCGAPPADIPHGHLSTNQILKDFSFSVGNTVIYKCEQSMGYTALKCVMDDRGDAMWSKPDRNCAAQPPLGNGTMGGLIMATINFVIAMTAILYSKNRHDREKKIRAAIAEAGELLHPEGSSE